MSLTKKKEQPTRNQRVAKSVVVSKRTYEQARRRMRKHGHLLGFVMDAALSAYARGDFDPAL